MTDLFVSLQNQRALTARLCVPFAGLWVADVDLDAAAELAGAVEMRIGTLALRGTVDPRFCGSFGQASRYRILAGKGGWSRPVTPKHYHNDAGVKLSTVALDAAREVGESLQLLPDVERRVGIDFVRAAAPASRILGQLLGAVPWWVGFDGATFAGTRPTTEAGKGVELLAFEPRQKIASLAVDDLRTFGIGTVLRARLDRPLTVRSFEVHITRGAMRVSALGEELAA
jgi:hypothetical protein